MPNYCDYRMKVIGASENVDEFIKILQAEYEEVPKHFWRIFGADVIEEIIDDGIKTAYIGGYCAWSVYSCMKGGPYTYNDDNGKQHKNGTTLEEQSNLLNLSIEVFSEEPGIGFQEHFLIKNGEDIIDECVDYAEWCFDDENEFDQYKKEYETLADFVWNDVDEDGCLKIGGFGEWDFQI